MPKTPKIEHFVFNSQHSKVEKLLQHSTLIFNTVLQTSANGVVLFDENGDLVYLNNNGYKILGILPGQDVGQDINLFSLIQDPEDALRIFKSFEAVEVITSFDFKDSTPESRNKQYKIRCMSLEEEGENIAYIGIITEITQHATTQDDRTEYQISQLNRLNTLIDHTLHESRISLWRFYFENGDLTQFRGEIIMGITNLTFKTTLDTQDFIEITSPTTYANIEKLIKTHILPENLNKSFTNQFEIFSDKFNKSSFIKIASVRVNDPKGQPEIIAAIHNITDIMQQKLELERSNFKLEQILKGGGLIQWEYDVISKQHISQTFPKDEKTRTPIPQDAIQSIGRNKQEEMQEIFNRLYNGEVFTADISYSYTPANSSEPLYFRSYITPYSLQDDGKVRRYIGYSKDITETENLILELNQAKTKAVNADRLKSQFLANMSHEIRTPLNAIVGFSDLLLTTECTEQQKQEWKKLIHNNSNLLTNLIDDILDLSKIEAGNINFNRTEFDFPTFFTEITSVIKAKHTNPKVQIIIINPYKQFVLFSDKNRLSQVINNFASNAIKHTQKGTITIGYEIQENSQILIYVRDTGKGISEENQKIVFERFEKLDHVTQGTGLGLAIVKAIMDEVNGQYGCESTLGEGSYFWVKGPIAITQEPQPTPPTLSDLDLDPYDTTLSPDLNILIAEDNESNFLLVSSMLHPCQITHAKNGAEAVQYASRQDYDIILMDIRMPLMDGYTAITKIRQFDTTTPIIILSANAFEEDKQRATQVGANNFIAKPIRRNTLIETIIQYTMP